MGKESLSKRASEIRKAAIKSRRSMKSKFSGPVVMTKTEAMEETSLKKHFNPDVPDTRKWLTEGGSKKRKTQKKRKTSRRK
jgi:hypothetical protein